MYRLRIVGDIGFEFWADIPDWEGLYQVSTYGRVKSLPRYRKSRNGCLCPVNERILKHKIDRYGYYKFYLSFNGNLKEYSAHRLVALAFIPNSNNYPVINHKDENKANNRVDNLEWCTVKYNNVYSIHKISQPIEYNGFLYHSIRECARKNGIDCKTVRYHLNNNTPFNGRFFNLK